MFVTFAWLAQGMNWPIDAHFSTVRREFVSYKDDSISEMYAINGF